MRILKEDVNGISVLLVEDSSADIRLTKEAFKKLSVDVRVNAVTNGEEAADFIFRRGKYSAAPEPDIVLLDLNVPKLDGISLISMIKEDEEKRRIPVLVLSTSRNEDDIKAAYDRHANAYMVKPINFRDFEMMVQSICNFWMLTAAYPERSV